MKGSKFLGVWLAAGLMVGAAVHAQTMYRWTDAKGNVHLSDKPPPADAKSVTREAIPRNTVSPADQRAAQMRAEVERAQLKQIEESRQAGADKPADTASAPRTETECQRLQREFEASASCWSGFNLAKGGARGGALEKCGPPVADPAARCPAK